MERGRYRPSSSDRGQRKACVLKLYSCDVRRNVSALFEEKMKRRLLILSEIGQTTNTILLFLLRRDYLTFEEDSFLFVFLSIPLSSRAKIKSLSLFYSSQNIHAQTGLKVNDRLCDKCGKRIDDILRAFFRARV